MNIINTPVGWLSIEEENAKLVDIEFMNRKTSHQYNHTVLEKETQQQLSEYFQGKNKKFNLPLNLSGTTFQMRVWQALQKIPYGQVKTYGQLAKELKSSARAVGNACRANPIPIIIPCHRIVAASGIGGYAGKTSGPVLERKRWLLAHEGVVL